MKTIPRHLVLPAVVAIATATGLHAQTFQTGIVPQDIVVTDFDRDGWNDFAIAHAFDDTVAIVRGDGGGGWLPPESHELGIVPAHPFNFPRAVDTADYNHDGYPDITVLCSGNFLFGAPPSLQTLLNRADGTFVPLPPDPLQPSVATDLFPVHFAFGEFTGDCHADIAVAQSRDFSVRIMEGDGTGRFSSGALVPMPVDSAGPSDLLILDIDFDGLDDLVAVSEDSLDLSFQSPSGTFSAGTSVALPVAGTVLRSVIATDFDGDGLRDLAIADAAGRVLLLSAFDATGGWASHTVLADASLAEPSDIATVYWDGDLKPDLAVTDFQTSMVTVFTRAGGIETASACPAARRVAAADANGDGVQDLFVLCQGDQSDSANPDAAILANPNVPVTSGTSTLVHSDTIGDNAGVRIAGAQMLSASNATFLWTALPSRKGIQEFNPAPNLNASPASRIRRQQTWPFSAGGIVFTGVNAYWVLERDAATVHHYNVNSGLQESVALATTPDTYGFTGLALDADTGDFYVSAALTGSILRFAADGTLLESTTVSPPAWDLGWDDDRSRLAAVNPARNDVRFFDASLQPDSGPGFDLSAEPHLYACQGITGIAKSANLDDFHLLLGNGLLLRREMATGDIPDVVAVAPVTEIAGMAIDSSGGLLTIGKDGFLLATDAGDPTDSYFVSLHAILATHPDFRFGGVAWDAAASELLVAHESKPQFARFLADGTFLGLVTPAALSSAGSFTGRIATEEPTGRVFLTTDFAAYSSADAFRIPVPHGTRAIAAGSGYLAGEGPAAGFVSLRTSDGSGEALAVYTGEPSARAIGFDAEGRLIVLHGDAQIAWGEFDIEVPTNTGLGDWRSY